MIPAVEILVNTRRVRELLTDPKRSGEILQAVETGREPYGMVSFDQSLKDLLTRNLVTYEDAVAQSTRPDDLALHARGVQRGDQAVGTPGAGPAAPRPATREPELELDDDTDDFTMDRFKKP